MPTIKESLRKYLPEGLYRVLQSGRDTLWHLRYLPEVTFHPWRVDSNRRIAKFKDLYLGKRCFVIGNGPSLKNTDMSLLRDEITFGMNRVYLAFQEWGFQTDFLVSINDLVAGQCHDEFRSLSLPKFFSWRSRNLLFPDHQPDDNTHFLFTTYTRPKFSRSLRSRFWEGATVTYVCLQLAYCMGFDEVYLVGVDHNFITKGEANKTVISDGDDPNHFNPDYFGKGFRWQLPDLEMSEKAYQLANIHYQQAGRQIYDATIGGKLTIFPKVDFASLFN